MNFQKRPTIAKINLEHLRYNTKQILSKVPNSQEAMGIVKANGYGHGAIFVARTLEACGIKKLGVATLSEGIELRNEGIRAEIHILDGLLGPISDYISNHLIPVIYEIDQLKAMSQYLEAEKMAYKVDLKFDTGMGRLGFLPSQVDDVIAIVNKKSHLKICSILTHLAKADTNDVDFTKRQYTLFRKLRGLLKDRGLSNIPYHICNSAAIIDGIFEDFQWVRPGIALYGCYPHPRHHEKIDLKPVMELKTNIFSLKKMPPGSSIGYGGTYVTERESSIAILPIGYADGVPRLISNRGYVLVHGKRAPIVGRISMDLMAIDVTDIPQVDLYDEVTLIGKNGQEMIRAEQVAEWAETISYEILCGISVRVPRMYVGI